MCVYRYTYDQRYDRALEIYLRLRHKDVYQLIHKHNLFSSINDKIVLLMDFDKEVDIYFTKTVFPLRPYRGLGLFFYNLKETYSKCQMSSLLMKLIIDGFQKLIYSLRSL